MQLQNAILISVCLAVSSFSGAATPEIAKTLQSIEGKTEILQPATDSAVIVFWATWCTSCRIELRKQVPSLALRKDITVVTVNTETDINRVKNFIRKEKLELPVYLDPTGELSSKRPDDSVPYWMAWKKGPSGWAIVDADTVFDQDRILKALKLPPKG